MRKGILLILLISTASFCLAQDELPTVVPDRPGNTYGTDVTQHHKITWDNGFAFESNEGSHFWTLNSTIVRYGIFENVEFRVGTDFVWPHDETSEKPTIGISPLTVGTKIKLYESSSWLPSVGLLVQLKSPHVGTKVLLPSHLAPSMYAIFEHSIGDRFSICYNVGAEWDGETPDPQTFLSLSLGYSFTESLGAFIESYNYLHRDGNRFMTEFGLTWLVSRRVQLDLEADLDLKNLGKYYSIGGGVSWLIN